MAGRLLAADLLEFGVPNGAAAECCSPLSAVPDMGLGKAARKVFESGLVDRMHLP